MEYDKLIYGKNSTERIVSIESQDEHLEIFQELEDGSIFISHIPNKRWILSSIPFGKNWIRLKGNLHYKWGKQFSNLEDFLKFRNINKDKDLFTIFDPKESALVNKGITYFKGMKHNEVSCLSFDIETTGLHHNEDSKILIISNTFRRKGELVRRLFSYSDYENEGEMLVDWCNWVREIDPSIILGHNIYTFDLPYMNFIANKHGVKLNLGRNSSPIRFSSYVSKFRIDGSRSQDYYKVYTYGRELIDTMFLSIKYDIGRKYESYGLKSIIKSENLEVKDRQFYNAESIKDNYKDPIEWEKIKKYAYHDADDALALYDLMSPSFFYLTQSVPKPYQLIIESASGSQINSTMIRSYLQEGHSLPKSDNSMKYDGAISFGNPGIYNNVFKIDVSSLYPSIMIEYKVYDSDKDPEGNFLKLVKIFTDRRLEHKKLAKQDKYYDDLQSSEKIFINSCYGFLGTAGLNFNSPTAAEFITRTGREILQLSLDWAKNRNLIISNGDTDSISFCKENQSFMFESERKELLNEVNSLYPERIKFENDGFYKKVIVIKAKNYIMKTEDDKIKFKGSALRDPKKEPSLKEFIQNVVQSIMDDKNDYIEIYNKYVKEINSITDIKRWSSRKTISDKVLNSERTNESKIRDAIGDSDYTEGDRVYVYFKQDDTLGLIEHFDGNYNKEKLLDKLYNTSKVFNTVLSNDLFVNYKLKKNKALLEELLMV